jgi:hypothetical protein
MELSLIGLQNAGKSSLVNVLTTGSFHEDMIPTVRRPGQVSSEHSLSAAVALLLAPQTPRLVVHSTLPLPPADAGVHAGGLQHAQGDQGRRDD